jgi:hypothetical protein
MIVAVYQNESDGKKSSSGRHLNEKKKRKIRKLLRKKPNNISSIQKRF